MNHPYLETIKYRKFIYTESNAVNKKSHLFQQTSEYSNGKARVDRVRQQTGFHDFFDFHYESNKQRLQLTKPVFESHFNI